MASIVSELQSLAPSAVIELFELHTSLELHGNQEIYRFHSGANKRIDAGDIIWNGYRYQRFPIEAEGFEFNGQQLPRPKLRVSNLFSVITAVLLNVNSVTPGNDLIGAKVIRIRTCARYLDAINFENNQNPYGSPDPTAEAPREVYFIDRKSSENRDFIEFELAAAIDLINVKLPGRQCISSVCQWVYRSPECGYTGSAIYDANDKPLSLITVPNFTAGAYSLTAGQSLNPEQFITSTNGWYRAVMQPDGNFVVYDKTLTAIWSTLTDGKGPSTFFFQQDGNLVIYDLSNRPTWTSNTQNQAAISSLQYTQLTPTDYVGGDSLSAPMVAAPNFSLGTSSASSIGSGFKIFAGESLTSANGWYRLLMQRDGNLVVYNKANAAVWSSTTSKPAYAWFQPDGNLVLYSTVDGQAIWSTQSGLATTATPAANLQIGSGVILASDTASSKLYAGQSLYSENGWYRLTMQTDGNLIIADKAGVVTWISNTAGTGASYAWFQGDGNFVLYDNANNAKWYSNTGSYPGNAGKKLYLQPDGNLVIYGYSTLTNNLVPAPNLTTGTGQILCANVESSKLYRGQSLYSTNGWYRLTMQGDGNLIIYNKAGKATWSTNTQGSAAYYAYFQSDGNLVLYDNTGVNGVGNPVWYSNTGQYESWIGYRWILNLDGELALLTQGNGVVWRSYTSSSDEPSVFQTSTTVDRVLWNTATQNQTEPTSKAYAVSTLSIANTGALTIATNGTTRWSNGYSSSAEPKVRQETGDARLHAFLFEIFGRADTQAGQTKTVTRTFEQGERTVTFTYTGTANFMLPAGHFSLQSRSWTLTSNNYVSSTGKWYVDEWIDSFIDTSATNPFRNAPGGTLVRVGRQYRVIGVVSASGILRLQDDGNLAQYDANNAVIWNTGYSNSVEPKKVGGGDGTGDVCGKRLSSCRLRFGNDADLPFGSFPGVGQYFA